MKDPLLNYIDKNREELDMHSPTEKNWDKINDRLKMKTNIRRLIIYSSSTAAVFLIGLLFFNQWKGVNKDEFVHLETTPYNLSSTLGIEDSLKMLRTSDISYNGNANYIDYLKKSKKLNNPNYGYLDGSTILYSIADGSINSTFSVSATHTNGCASNNTYHINFDNGGTTAYQNLDSDKISAQKQQIYYEVDRYYEQYEEFTENEFESPLSTPLSTFGIDVDGAGYSNMRRFVKNGYLPPKYSVKLEEMVNYFNYDLPEPKGEHPFSVTTEVVKCPWENNHLLMQIALKGKSIEMKARQKNNLVFLIDVSGSMQSPDKLPLLKKSLSLLVNQMKDEDKISIVVYAGAAGLVLPPTSGKFKSEILNAINVLETGGSTNGEDGIHLAYKTAKESFFKDGNNRVILATDGDFNVGVSDDNALVNLIEKKRETGIFLSVLGFGTGNLQSSKMEKLADNGNGNYFYIDNLLEAKKVLVNEIGGTLTTIAKDVKIQLEFNPEVVKNYRLLGYENRIMAAKDFNDDKKDSGDLGSGHTIVALYEIIPMDSLKVQKASGLRYQSKIAISSKGLNDELAVLKLRYKRPKENKSRLIETIVKNSVNSKPSKNLMFASAVAEFGLLIRESSYKGNASFENIIQRANNSKGEDKFGYRSEFIRLVQIAKVLVDEYQVKIEQ